MSFRRALWAFAVVSLAAPIAVRAQGDYLDVYVVKVKPDKVAEFETINKKWVDANRRFHGDRWITTEVVYGEGNVYQFVSSRKDYADLQSAQDTGMAAVIKAYGKEGALKLEQDFYNCLVSSRSELRRRRPDLSTKVPTDPDAFAKLIGESRFVRTTAVHIRPGHVPEFEALAREIKEAGEKNPNTQPALVSQAVEGTKGTTFYVTTLRSALTGFDHNPTLRDILGDEGFKKFQHMSADAIEVAESTLYRFNPTLSNPTDEVTQVAADFWHPKATGAISASTVKPKASTVQPASTKEAVKKP